MSDPLETIQLQQISTELKDGTHGTHQRVNVGIPFLSAKNIGKNGQINWSQEDDRISLREFELIHSNFSLVPGDLLLTIVGSLGRAAVYRGERVTFQRSVAYIRPNPTLVSSAFLHQAFRHPSFQRQLISRSNATAQAGLYLGELAKTEVPLFRLEEQQKIAQILDTLDTQIQKTEALIAKLEIIKEGLLNDLLTRGIDQTGQLRPTPEQAPELYKESALGLIPKEWAISNLQKSCSEIIDCPHSTPDFQDYGVLVARTSNIKGGVFEAANASKVSEKEYLHRIARLEPKAGDLILTREAPVGEAFVIPTGMKICLGQRVMLLRPDRNKMLGEFLLAQIYSGKLRDRIQILTAGTTNPHLNVSEVSFFTVPLPELSEQKAILRRVMALEVRLDREKKKSIKATKIKSGLMDDLLTGHVSVTALLNETV